MEYQKEHDLRIMHLNFIGKTLSGFTHELKNHLAFIKESAGLVGDLMGSKKSFSKQDVQQSLDILQSIDNQIGKTSEFCNYLNRFAHRMDTSFSTFDVNDSIEELLALLSRFASHKRISLEKDFQKDIPALYSNPSKLQLILFCLIEERLIMLEKNSKIIVKTARVDESVTIGIVFEGNKIEAVEQGICSETINEYAIGLLGGTISQKDDSKVITLPLSPPPNIPLA